jgi:hypothetical protein
MEEEYFEICVGHLESAKESLESGGLNQLVSNGYQRYLEYPSGPYVFCFSQSPFSVDTIGQSVLVLHPFTPNNTLDELLGTEEKENILRSRKAELVSSALKNGALGNFFNYTEPYSRDKSLVEGGIQVDSEEKKLVGFVDRLDDDVVVQCGCRYTGVPVGERDNKNAVMESQGVSASSDSFTLGGVSIFLFVSLFFQMVTASSWACW